MLYGTKQLQLKNGAAATLRAPAVSDAAQMIEYLRTCAGETDFILRYPEECGETVEQEEQFLQNVNDSSTNMMIVCEVNGEIAGNCQLVFNKRIKVMHRASVMIAIKKKFWNLGIGTAFFNEMIDVARRHGIMQLELEFVEGNDRARHLYEKLGFRIVSVKPDAIRLKDGTLLNEYCMVKKL